ncbi:MAG: type 1 glutamine amidotransferase [Acidobacteria bacterium]|nr:MAG: type 1 glutamine amidotransferase [Acidobacteriota bacterium]
MDQKLSGKRIAVLATHGFEQSELIEPKRALEQAGAKVDVVSPESGAIKGWNHKQWGEDVKVDRAVAEVKADEYDGLVLPGGVMNPDKLRMNPQAVQLVRAFFDQGKPIASICHGPWLLVEANVVKGLKMTSWPSLQTDIRNAGGEWADQECVVDRGVVTSRKPDDLPAFNRKAIEEFAEGVTAAHRARTRAA